MRPARPWKDCVIEEQADRIAAAEALITALQFGKTR
jgi:hypothetical protein